MKKIVISLGFLIISIFVLAQTPPDTLWTKTFGGNFTVHSVSTQKTFDGGFITLCNASSEENGHPDILIIKTDENGNEQWQQIYGGVETEYAGDIKQTTDGGFVIVGTTQSYGSYYNKIWLIKTDEFGNQEWSQLFGNYDNRGKSIIQTSDGGFIIAGSTWITDNNNYFDALLIKTDENGNQEWSQTYGNSLWDEVLYINQNENNEYLVCGLQQETQGWFFKTDSSGNVIWSQTFSVLGHTYISQFIETNDQEYILVGNTYSTESDILVVKTNENGNEVWIQTFNGNNDASSSSICNAISEGYVISGTTSNEIWLLNIDNEGEEIWNQTYSFGATCNSTYIQNIDDGYIVSGSFLPIDNDYMNCLLMRLNSEEVDLSENLAEIENHKLDNYPNPFNPTTIIEFSIQNDSKVDLSIFNIKGQKIKALFNDEIDKGNHSISWNGTDDLGNAVSSGVYFYMLRVNEDTDIVKKCLLLK